MNDTAIIKLRRQLINTVNDLPFPLLMEVNDFAQFIYEKKRVKQYKTGKLTDHEIFRSVLLETSGIFR